MPHQRKQKEVSSKLRGVWGRSLNDKIIQQTYFSLILILFL